MKIGITGSGGYLGKLLTNQLIKNGHKVIGVKRSLLYGIKEDLAGAINNCDVIINLAGVSVLKRWTNSNKKLIYESRITTTRNLVQAIKYLPIEQQPRKLISASAIGIYKNGKTHNEDSTDIADSFIGNLVTDWEAALEDLPTDTIKTIFRIGLVLGKNAKTIKNLKLPFQIGLGGKTGSGQQAFPFIHETDLVRAFVWAINNQQVSGVFNLVAPQKITNAEFTHEFARQINRPAFFTIPGFVFKLIMGEASELLLDSPAIEPKALIESGFQFQYKTIGEALHEILT